VALQPNAGHSLLTLEVFLDHTQWRTTVNRTPLDEWSAHCRDLYLTTHNPHNRQTSMPPVGFEPTISAGERPQTYGLDRTATGTSINITLPTNNMYNRFQAFTITSYHLFMAFSISMVTSTDRAMVMGWGSLKTRQSTPLNSSPSPMQARWWVCKISR